MREDRRRKPEPPPEEEPPTREEQIDDVLEATFPASDPPTWDSVARTPSERDDARP